MRSRLFSVVKYAIAATLFAGFVIGRAIDGYSCTEACVQQTAPVCGSNGITYRNPCMLNADNCQYKKAEDKIVKLFEGACKTDPSPEKCRIECPNKKTQLCGSNRRNYDSYCDLIISNCKTRSYVQVVGRGPCQKTKAVIQTY